METVDVYGNKYKVENKLIIVNDQPGSSIVNALCGDSWIVISVTATKEAWAVLLQRQTLIESVTSTNAAPSPFADFEDDDGTN